MDRLKMKGAELVKSTTGTNAKVLAVNSGACRLHALHVYNAGTGTDFVQVHDSAGAPSDMTALRLIVKLATLTGDTITIPGGMRFNNGIYVYGSQASGALTAIAAADLHITVTYDKEAF